MLRRFVMTVIVFCTIFSFSSTEVLAESSEERKTVDEWFEDNRDHDQLPVEEQSDDGKQGSERAYPLMKMFVALAFILFLIYGLAKFVNKRTRAFAENRAIATIGGVSVGNNRSVQVVKIGDRLLVVGVGDTVQLLKEISDEEETEKLVQESSQDASYDVLQKAKQWFQKRTSANKSVFSTILDQELRQISGKRKTFYNTVHKKESNNE